MEKKPTRYYSSKQEQKVADWLDGALTINSGASYKKGDILLKDTIVECKTKTKQTISHAIKKEWILDLQKECIEMGKTHWALIFDFGTQNINDQYVIIPIDDYKEYLNLKEEKNV